MKTKTKNCVEQEQKQPVIFLQGERVRLRPFEMSDLDRCTLWINDPDIRKFVTAIFPTTSIQEESFINDKDDPSKHVKLAIETNDGVHIGNISIGKINWIDRTAETGTLIGDKRYWSKGYGTEAKMLLMNYAFNSLNLRKLHSAAFSFNERSINYSLKCGYKIIGRKKEEKIYNGKFYDIVMLEVFKEEWEVAHDVWIKSQKNKIPKRK